MSDCSQISCREHTCQMCGGHQRRLEAKVIGKRWHVKCRYRTAGNIGGQLNLAVWQLGKRPSNLNPSNLSAIYAINHAPTIRDLHSCACMYIRYTCSICTELPPNLNPPIFIFWPLGTKPPNLKIANISSYTVCQHVDALLLPVRIILCMAMLLHYSILYM